VIPRGSREREVDSLGVRQVPQVFEEFDPRAPSAEAVLDPGVNDKNTRQAPLKSDASDHAPGPLANVKIRRLRECSPLMPRRTAKLRDRQAVEIGLVMRLRVADHQSIENEHVGTPAPVVGPRKIVGNESDALAPCPLRTPKAMLSKFTFGPQL
jgi:hypothetical protein